MGSIIAALRQISMGKLKLNKKLDTRAFIVFQRLQRFHKTNNIVSALVGGLSLAVLTFNEFHTIHSTLLRTAEGFLCSSALSSVIAITSSIMLMFRFEEHGSATRKELAIAWSPLVILDLAIIEYLLGLVFWYAAKNNNWRTALMSAQLALYMLFTLWMALWMWNTMSEKGGLGRIEDRAASEGERVADN